LERKIKLCEVLALEDFKAWMKNMKKQGTRGSRFFIGWNIKACYYEENKKKAKKSRQIRRKKDKEIICKKSERNDKEGRKIKVYDEIMLSLWI